MHHIQKIKKRSVAPQATIVLVAIVLGTGVSGAVAAGRGGGGGFSVGHIGRGFNARIPDGIPSAPAPVFNPSTPYTVSPLRETPVSPASPGSVFGND
jgi:hypothetical protein